RRAPSWRSCSSRPKISWRPPHENEDPRAVPLLGRLLGRRARLARPRARRRAGVREGERRGARGAARRALRGGRLWVHLGRAAHLRRVDRAGPRTRTRGPGGFEAEARPRGPTSMIQALAIGVPPSSHFIYIPVIFTLGIVIGFVLGAKATR